MAGPVRDECHVLGRSQELTQLPGRDSQAVQGFLLDQNRAAKIRVAGIDGGRDGQGREESEQRPKLVLDDQRVTRSAARGREQTGLLVSAPGSTRSNRCLNRPV